MRVHHKIYVEGEFRIVEEIEKTTEGCRVRVHAYWDNETRGVRAPDAPAPADEPESPVPIHKQEYRASSEEDAKKRLEFAREMVRALIERRLLGD